MGHSKKMQKRTYHMHVYSHRVWLTFRPRHQSVFGVSGDWTLKSLIQSSKTLPVELTETHYLVNRWCDSFWLKQRKFQLKKYWR